MLKLVIVKVAPSKALPVGHYRIEETQAPTGYLKDGAKTLEFEITKDGEMVRHISSF